MLAIVTALLLGDPLAGLIVVLMQTGGEALERYAEGRASRAVRELEAARLTGEPLPVSASPGTRLLSGSLNLDGPLTIRATARARESQYARIVELVRNAQESRAPLQRLADRYAVWFTPLTLLACAATYVLTRDPVRVLAVLVVATPCPLILATPVAVVGGINRAARRGIIFRHGSALEQLAGITVAILRALARAPRTPGRVRPSRRTPSSASPRRALPA